MSDIANLTREAEAGHGGALKAELQSHDYEQNLKLMQQIVLENKRHIVDDPNTPELMLTSVGYDNEAIAKLNWIGTHWYTRSKELVYDSLSLSGDSHRAVGNQEIRTSDYSIKK